VQLSTLTGDNFYLFIVRENYSFALFEQINRCIIAVFVRRVNNDLHTIAVLRENESFGGADTYERTTWLLQKVVILCWFVLSRKI
jgi:hypothetical protein